MATLAEARQQRGMTQLELSRRTGISFQTISEIENGRKARASTIRKLADALGLEPEVVAGMIGVDFPAARVPAAPRSPRSDRTSGDGLAPMGLAILGLLREEPMHPYEMVSRMRVRHVDMYIKVNFGAVYYHIDQLQRRRLIDVQDVEREGNRPERTVYTITEAGRRLLQDELVAAMSSMTRHYDPVDAGLHLAHLLSPDVILPALRERYAHLQRLRQQLGGNTRSAWSGLTLSQLHILRRHLIWLEAEEAWLEGYMQDVEAGVTGLKVTDPALAGHAVVQEALAGPEVLRQAS